MFPAWPWLARVAAREKYQGQGQGGGADYFGGQPAGITISGPTIPRSNVSGPVRMMDTRDGTGGVTGPVGPGAMVSLQVTGVNGVPAAFVNAVILNVTVTGATASSFVTVCPDGQARPATSNIDFTAGQTTANLVIVPVGADGKVDFYNNAGSVDIIADIVGYFPA